MTTRSRNIVPMRLYQCAGRWTRRHRCAACMKPAQSHVLIWARDNNAYRNIQTYRHPKFFGVTTVWVSASYVWMSLCFLHVFFFSLRRGKDGRRMLRFGSSRVGKTGGQVLEKRRCGRKVISAHSSSGRAFQDACKSVL